MSAEPEQVNFVLEHLGKITTALIVLLLGILRLLGKKERATIAKSVLIETPVSHAELLQCQMEVSKELSTLIKENFSELRKEFLEEIRILHQRINEER